MPGSASGISTLRMMLAVVVVLIVLVQAVQTIGDRLARRLNKRLRHGP
jgi:D-methionine transport system permease protein